MWDLDYKEGWAPKNWCFWTVVLEKTLESPLERKDIQPVHPGKRKSVLVFIGRTDAEVETPILWPPDVKKWLLGKDRDAGERLRAGGEGGDRGWDGWTASPTRRTWVWVSSKTWWWTGRPGVLQSMGSRKVRHDWATELNWTESSFKDPSAIWFSQKKKKKRFLSWNKHNSRLGLIFPLFIFVYVYYIYLFIFCFLNTTTSIIPSLCSTHTHTHTHTQYFSFSLRDSPWEYRLSCGKLNLLSAFFAWAILSNWTVFWMPCP